ncbi:hypothetical protein [Acinetobacter pseudolwoffii]|uniref:hypothetical protein n=1 Tax=Acinetobacter pseudolwoffii TaxID=2053287 RepID=UPI000C24C0C2|nr:hypothetical protein [Acinetobacter pseudolwoffii]PJI36327.1 hypothetical protein CU318_01955 [Acinetobacter pseudolwoffii]
MMIQPEIIETVLQENGINRPDAKMIVEQLKMVMSERSGDIQPYINNLYVKAIEMNIKPSQNGTISEQQAVKLLGKSKAFFRVARNYKRLTPASILVENGYRYTLYDLAEYLAKRDSYKAL